MARTLGAASITRLEVECARDGSPMLAVGFHIPLSLLIPAVMEFQKTLAMLEVSGQDNEMNSMRWDMTTQAAAEEAQLLEECKGSEMNAMMPFVISTEGLNVGTGESWLDRHPSTQRSPPGLTIPISNTDMMLIGEATGEQKSKSKSSKPKPRIHELAAAGKVEELKEALIEEPEMLDFAWGESSVTPLILAAVKGRSEVARTLLAARADVNKAGLDKTSRDRATPAFWSAHKGHIESLQVLIEAKANLSLRSGNGATPVFAAAQKGCVGALRLLLEARADADQARDDKVTPALIAASEDHADILDVLIEHNADIDKRSCDGVSPACIAAQKNHGHSLQVLLAARAEVNKGTVHGATPAYIAAWMGHASILQALIASAADVNAARTDDGTSPIFVSALEGHAECVYVLARARANISHTCRGRSPLQEAVKRERLAATAVMSCALGYAGLALPDEEDPATAVALAVRAYSLKMQSESSRRFVSSEALHLRPAGLCVDLQQEWKSI